MGAGPPWGWEAEEQTRLTVGWEAEQTHLTVGKQQTRLAVGWKQTRLTVAWEAEEQTRLTVAWEQTRLAVGWEAEEQTRLTVGWEAEDEVSGTQTADQWTARPGIGALLDKDRLCVDIALLTKARADGGASPGEWQEPPGAEEEDVQRLMGLEQLQELLEKWTDSRDET
ncbi:hypothetical protein CYMTET_52343 [Cymbomonas tetramitiformis]|uniref:Uncharacterized protein n=1 Tax=Cymbomonas tetramitiformis TaxID=36881 RepID=A0AAE0BL11_9CHLO|nr:hypothetical protein CYMTET_52343 [Cymbomonas tetramitiformis]